MRVCVRVLVRDRECVSYCVCYTTTDAYTNTHAGTHTRTHTSLASQPYFSAYVHAHAKVGREREGNIRQNRHARI